MPGSATTGRTFDAAYEPTGSSTLTSADATASAASCTNNVTPPDLHGRGSRHLQRPDTVVPAWVDHSDLSFTKRVYVHPDPQSLKTGSENLGELLG